MSIFVFLVGAWFGFVVAFVAEFGTFVFVPAPGESVVEAEGVDFLVGGGWFSVEEAGS